MNEYNTEYIASCFKNTNSIEINKFQAKYKQDLIDSILNKKFDNMHFLANINSEIRDNIEFDTEIKRTKEFYFGYMYAYESLMVSLYKIHCMKQNINKALKNDIFKRIIMYLNNNSIATEEDLLNNLHISPDELYNTLNIQEIKKINFIDMQVKCMAIPTFFYLTSIGKDYLVKYKIN